MSTPSESLRRASETLRAEVKTAIAAFEARDWQTYAIALERICEWGFSDTELALLVADILQRAADDHDETPCPAIAAALALAEHINGRTT